MTEAVETQEVTQEEQNKLQEERGISITIIALDTGEYRIHAPKSVPLAFQLGMLEIGKELIIDMNSQASEEVSE